MNVVTRTLVMMAFAALGIAVYNRKLLAQALSRLSSEIGNRVLTFGQLHPHLNRVLHVVLNLVPDFASWLVIIAGLGYLMPGVIQKLGSRKAVRIWIMVVFIAFGIFSIIVNAVNREDQDYKQADQGNRLDSVQKSNTQILGLLISSKGKTSEADRRKSIEQSLTNEYILSNDPIDPEILAGNKMPPQEWMNGRLHQLGETWRVAPAIGGGPAIIQQIIPEPKKAKLDVSFYQDDPVSRPTHDFVAQVDQDVFKVEVSMFVIGETPAKNVHMWFRVCNGCTWVSDPPGSISLPEHPTDREFVVPEMLPNVALPKITLAIKRPAFSKATRIGIGFYYSCENCAPVDSKKPIPLWVQIIGAPTPPILSAPYRPRP
ncbi:MAG TPA: hypothetical protein VND66_12440 [Acidobacteriaceae bacterium]|nr:hypothetical protein [Acidobacteriaceae bacterium]